MGRMYQAEVNNLQLWGTHGHFEEERVRGQKLQVDIRAAYDMLDMCRTDRLDREGGYLELCRIATRVVEEEQHRLLQRVAWRILEEAFGTLPRLEWIRVTIRKPAVPVQKVVDSVAVVLEMTREEFLKEASREAGTQQEV